MYLITGATGHVGSQLVEQLLARGKKVRVFTRDKAKVAHWGDRVEVATGDFSQPETVRQAATKVDGVFLMNGAGQHNRFPEVSLALKQAAVPRVVFLSSLAGDEFAIGKLHRQQEASLANAAVPHVVLRPGMFMANFYQWAATIKSDGAVYNAMGAGKSAPIAPDDIAAVAAAVLVDGYAADRPLELTGSELTSTADQVRTLSQVLGREIRCVDVPVEAAVQGMIRNGLPPALAGAVGESFRAVRDGHTTFKTDTVQRVLGRPPMPLADWFRKNVARFQGGTRSAPKTLSSPKTTYVYECKRENSCRRVSAA